MDDLMLHRCLGFLFYVTALVVVTFFCIFLYFKYSFTHWYRRGVPYIKPKIPFGNNNSFGTGAFSYGIESLDWYREIKKRGLKYGGAWSWDNPLLVIVDPEYIKTILVKDFDHFTDRHFFHNPKYDPKNESLFVVEKDEWKYMRQNLSPTFTPVKMKTMFEGVKRCTVPLIQCLEESVKNGEIIDIKDVMSAYTIDVIGANIYGLQLESFKAKDSKFREIGREVFNITWMKGIKVIFFRMYEKIARNLGITILSRDIIMSFDQIVKDTVEYRRKNEVKYQDFMQLSMDLHDSTKDKDRPYTFDHLVSNIIVFFLAGFDTSATTLSFCLYHLAMNPEIQEKLRNEIMITLKACNGDLTFEAMKNLTYLRQILDETLRLYPPINALSRVTVKSYKLKDSNLILNKGDKIIIPVVGLHRDPEYFPDPDRFDPDRFSPERKNSIPSNVYMPFGDGPRACIGMRFALMQMTLGLVEILSNFRFSQCDETVPVKPKRGVFIMAPNNVIYLKAEKICND
ncbi:hypothetical protein GWI33_019501 [Rhynchophorus ferrugineus]|uniref:Cytochrome P450 n=1 Tax=Rhynchophorus ferrugineus TaxID=354439 RepID=A0A834M1C1_RHYFE|nr:hypothetical protein GWI33_019501 [Rhynchophorus ferrugineus]